MNDDVVTYFYDESDPVRVVNVHGTAWVVAEDVCAVVGLGDVAGAMERLDEADRLETPIGSDGPMWVVNELGLYDLIRQSYTREARPFRRWMASVVLPAIRLAASTPEPSTVDTNLVDVNAIGRRELAQMVLDAESRADQAEIRAKMAEAHVDVLTPAAAAWTRLAGAQGDYSVRDAAHILTHAGVPDLGPNRLLVVLRELRWVDRDGKPYQRQIETGRIGAKLDSYTHPHSGQPRLSVTVRITAKGLFWLLRHLSPVTAEVIPAQREASE